MTDPRSLTPEKRHLLDLCEKIALLPRPIQEPEFEPAADDVIDELEERNGGAMVTDAQLIELEAEFRSDGHVAAADGVALMLMVIEMGVAKRAGDN